MSLFWSFPDSRVWDREHTCSSQQQHKSAQRKRGRKGSAKRTNRTHLFTCTHSTGWTSQQSEMGLTDWTPSQPPELSHWFIQHGVTKKQAHWTHSLAPWASLLSCSSPFGMARASVGNGHGSCGIVRGSFKLQERWLPQWSLRWKMYVAWEICRDAGGVSSVPLLIPIGRWFVGSQWNSLLPSKVIYHSLGIMVLLLYLSCLRNH